MLEGQSKPEEEKISYITISVVDKDIDFKIEKKGETQFEITNLTDNQKSTVEVKDLDYQYGSLLRFNLEGKESLVQFLEEKEGLHFNFYYKGNTVSTTAYDQTGYNLKKHMAPPKKLDLAKNIISPMPGAIVSVAVEVG